MAPLAYAVLAVIVVLLSTAEGFSAKQGALGQFLRRTRASPTSQFSFTPGPRDGERKITREKDAEGEYFESDFDRRPIKERLPVALGFLGAVSLPFIIGLIYLYSNK